MNEPTEDQLILTAKAVGAHVFRGKPPVRMNAWYALTDEPDELGGEGVIEWVIGAEGGWEPHNNDTQMRLVAKRYRYDI